MLNVTFFENVEELEKLTGLTEHELWNAGFDLDDMDFGLAADKKLHDEWEDEDVPIDTPYYECWLTNRMNEHCVGYHHVFLGGTDYYTVHHA